MVMSEEGFDPDAFQAQIDLSLSLTQDLVSSWLHPSYKLSKTSRSTEKELEEYMRRPPRLGVGAAAPQNYSTNSREAAKLRSRLSAHGKRRNHDEIEDRDKGSDPDQAEESKGSRLSNITLQNTSTDPFRIGRKNKRKANDILNDANEQDTLTNQLKSNVNYSSTSGLDSLNKSLSRIANGVKAGNANGEASSSSPIIHSKNDDATEEYENRLEIRFGGGFIGAQEVDNIIHESFEEEEEWSGILSYESSEEAAQNDTFRKYTQDDEAPTSTKPGQANADSNKLAGPAPAGQSTSLGLHESTKNVPTKKKKKRRKT